MRNLLRVVCSLLLVLSVSILLTAAGDAEAGKALFKKKCATCHGKDGSGNPKMAKMLKVELTVDTPTVAKMNYDALVKLVTKGRGKKKAGEGNKRRRLQIRPRLLEDSQQVDCGTGMSGGAGPPRHSLQFFDCDLQFEPALRRHIVYGNDGCRFAEFDLGGGGGLDFPRNRSGAPG